MWRSSRKVTIFVPKGPRYAVAPGHVGALEKRSRPRPLTDNDRRNEAGLDHAPSRTVEINEENT
jgi:hypothetical protein